MVNDPIAARYAQTAFEAAKAEGRVDETLEQLTRIGQLLRDHAELRQLLWNPDVDPEEKVGVFDRVFQGAWSGLVRSFVMMVVSMGRSESLAGMVEAFQDAVDADQGLLRVTVRSARPVTEGALARLRRGVEQRERKRVELTAQAAPELLGGVQIVFGGRVVDGSVRRQLDDLRRQLHAVRVY